MGFRLEMILERDLLHFGNENGFPIGDDVREGMDRNSWILEQEEEQGEEQEAGDHENDKRIQTRRWFEKLLDTEETKRQLLFALPLTITNVSYYSIALVSVMFAGHLGELQLAAANLANSWATVTGFAFMVGLSGALETLCGQGYGAKLYSLMGIHLQATSLISLFFSFLVSILWLYTKPILIFLHQDPDIATQAALFIKFYSPGIFAYGLLQNILRFLQTQSVVVPLVVCSVLPLLAHIGIAYFLVHCTPMCFKGAALAASISIWLALLMLGSYVLCSKRFAETWNGFSMQSFRHVVSNLKLALPSAAMVCLEYWAFELLVLLAGLMPDSEITTSLIAMCVNTEAIAYMITYGLSAAASMRVSNELGAGNSVRAKHAMGVTLKLSVLLAVAINLALGFGHDMWAGLFSDSSTVIWNFDAFTPFLLTSIFIDSIQGVLSGVARGCGWQKLAVLINLGTFYMIGMPTSIFVAFKAKLYAKGLWLGLICGLSCQTVALLMLTCWGKWRRLELTKSETISHA